MSLIDRIHNMIIAMPYGLERMLELMDLEESHSVKTACVPIGGKPKILINPDFVEQNCETDHKLFMLIQHELHHVLLGHTRLFKRISPIHNIAFDAIINAMLCRSQPRPEWTALFRDSYSKNVFPLCLLRPPEHFPLEPKFPQGMPQSVQGIIRTLYYSTDGTFLEVFELITQIYREMELDCVGSTECLDELMGNHSEDTGGLESGDDPELFDTVRDVVEKWPQPPQPINGRSLNDVLKDECAQEITPKEHVVGQIIQAIIRSAKSFGSIPGRFAQYETQFVQQFLPSRDRRAFAMQQVGDLIPIYTAQNPKLTWVQNTVTIYLDVSGSMDRYIEVLLGAIRLARRKIPIDIVIFCTQATSLSLEELEQGKYRTTGGTNAECVWSHLIDNQIVSAVLLTDGYVGKVPVSHLGIRKRVNIQCLLTPDGWTLDIDPVAHGMDFLKGI